MTQFFTAPDGTRMAYKDEGDGLPVLCLAGLVMLAAPWLITISPRVRPLQDEATAARRPELRWRPMTGAETPCPQ